MTSIKERPKNILAICHTFSWPMYTWYHQFLLFYVHMYILSVPSFCISNALKFFFRISVSTLCINIISKGNYLEHILVVWQQLGTYCLFNPVFYVYFECSWTLWVKAELGLEKHEKIYMQIFLDLSLVTSVLVNQWAVSSITN